MVTTVLFDLDGTLTDPYEGITNAAMYALKRIGREREGKDGLESFIGPPLLDSFRDACGLGEEEARRAFVYYREYYAEKGKFENRVYEGIPEMLERLCERGLRLAVATSKPEIFSKQIIERFGLARYIPFVCGATLDNSRVQKADVIRYALETLGIGDAAEAVMVGDRKHDVLGARANNLSCIGVLYGYGSEQELRDAGAKVFAAAPSDLPALI